jgi:hypothetical protein
LGRERGGKDKTNRAEWALVLRGMATVRKERLELEGSDEPLGESRNESEEGTTCDIR